MGLTLDTEATGDLRCPRDNPLTKPSSCEACSAFTRVAACTLARSPIVTANRRLQPFRYLHDCSDRFRLERVAGWGLHPLESAAFSRRTPKAAVCRTAVDPRGSTLKRQSVAQSTICHCPSRSKERCYPRSHGNLANVGWNVPFSSRLCCVGGIVSRGKRPSHAVLVS